MKILIDFFPILLFFGAYKLYGIYVGTAVLMAATAAQMALLYAIDRRLSALHKATFLLIFLFGALTLALQDERFIKWKPTVLYGAMSIALAVAVWVMKKNFLQILLGSQVALPARIWHRLNVAWIIYFAFMSALNAYVVVNFSTEAWVDFKLWGYAIPFVFLAAQGFYVMPHIKNDDPTA
jgi:intracellular septation protein